MPNPTLITGGAGSGKTEAVISRLSALYEADPFAEVVAITPTLRHGDQFRRRLVERCGVALRLSVVTINQFSHQLASDVWIPSGALVEELLARTIRREIQSGPAAYFAPIAHTRGLVGLVSGAVNDLLAEAVHPRAFAAAAEESESPSLKALAAIYTAYRAELQRRGWAHPAQIAETAADTVIAGASLPPVVTLDGFHLFRGTELKLLEALAERTEVVITLDPGAGARARHDYERLRGLFPAAQVHDRGDASTNTSTVVSSSAADREAQLRAIARQIKRRLTDDPSLRPSDFAVTFRRVSPYLSLARQIFAEYDLPLDPAAAERLSARPLGTWLRRLLQLAQEGWRLRDVVSALSSGFIDLGRWHMSRDDVARFARWARQSNLWGGKDKLERAADGLKAEADKDSAPETTREELRRAADGVTAALEELRAMLERPVSSPAEHARRLEEALFGATALVSADARRRPGVDTELDALRGYLREIILTHETLGDEPEPFEVFLLRLEGKLDAPAVLLQEAGGALLAPMHTLHGLRFHFVAVGGLIEGEFPAPRSPAALLGGSARDLINSGGPVLPPEPRLSEDELWDAVATRADGVTSLWRTRLDERGRPAAPSYYFDREKEVEALPPAPEQAASRRELAVACALQWPDGGRLRPREEPAWPVVRKAAAVEQRRRSFSNAGVYEGRLAAGLAPGLTGTNAVWSASRLESYRTCAFQFFGHYALRLEEMDEEMDGADAAMRGTMVHEILQEVLKPLVERGAALTPDTLPEAIERLRTRGAEMWSDAPEVKGFGRAALWRLDAETTLRQIEMMLGREAERSKAAGVTRIIGAEEQVITSLPLDPPMRVTAGIDRLDEGSGLVVIVDYKSGSQITRAQVADGRRLQLQLYGYLGQERAKAQRVIARYAWLDPNTTNWDIDSSRKEDAAILDSVIAVAGAARSAVESGDFRVFPQVQPCPSYCSFKHICRVNEFSRWKWRD